MGIEKLSRRPSEIMSSTARKEISKLDKKLSEVAIEKGTEKLSSSLNCLSANAKAGLLKQAAPKTYSKEFLEKELEKFK